MTTLEIGIIYGTSTTYVFLADSGIVLNEPTCIAFLGERKRKNVRAIGQYAYEMTGKSPQNTFVISPISEGIIHDPLSLSILLKEFLKKIVSNNSLIKPRIKAIVGVPMGLSVAERKKYGDVAYAAGIKEVKLIENILLSGVGLQLPVHTAYGGLVVSIGGGVTEVAAISLSSIVQGCAISVGTNLMDKALCDHVSGRYNLKIGMPTAKKLRMDIGSLLEKDISTTMVSGLDLSTKYIRSEKVRAEDVYSVLRPYYLRVRDAVESIINMLPPELASDVYASGIHVVGGAARIIALGDFLSYELDLRVHIPQDPEYAAILGAGQLLSNKTLLRDILSQK
ncbi:MAG: rod shape-determining protein [Firmicutes bacterium]|nr:rod shape-determining protein [Bacillota bacterium]